MAVEVERYTKANTTGLELAAVADIRIASEDAIFSIKVFDVSSP